MSSSIWTIIICLALAYVGKLLISRLGSAAARQTAKNLAARLDTEPDKPKSFGYNTTWLAIPADDDRRVDSLATALDLRDPQPANWQSGMRAAAESRGVFVSPAVNGWHVVIGPQLPDLGGTGRSEDARPLLKALAAKLPDFCYFASHRGSDYYAWARVTDGKPTRAFAYFGDIGKTLCDQGSPTADEEELAFNFFADEAPPDEGDDYWARTDLRLPDDQDVLAVAARWSFDPTNLAKHDSSPGVGIFGQLPRPGDAHESPAQTDTSKGKSVDDD